jgi:hypothetical protein
LATQVQQQPLNEKQQQQQKQQALAAATATPGLHGIPKSAQHTTI